MMLDVSLCVQVCPGVVLDDSYVILEFYVIAVPCCRWSRCSLLPLVALPLELVRINQN